MLGARRTKGSNGIDVLSGTQLLGSTTAKATRQQQTTNLIDVDQLGQATDLKRGPVVVSQHVTRQPMARPRTYEGCREPLMILKANKEIFAQALIERC